MEGYVLTRAFVGLIGIACHMWGTFRPPGPVLTLGLIPYGGPVDGQASEARTHRNWAAIMLSGAGIGQILEEIVLGEGCLEPRII